MIVEAITTTAREKDAPEEKLTRWQRVMAARKVAQRRIAEGLSGFKGWTARQWARLPFSIKLLLIVAVAFAAYFAWYVAALYLAMISVWLVIVYFIVTFWLFILLYIKVIEAVDRPKVYMA